MDRYSKDVEAGLNEGDLEEEFLFDNMMIAFSMRVVICILFKMSRLITKSILGEYVIANTVKIYFCYPHVVLVIQTSPRVKLVLSNVF